MKVLSGGIDGFDAETTQFRRVINNLEQVKVVLVQLARVQGS